MTTQNNFIENLENPFKKTVFIEYSSSKRGQHFITVMQTVEGKRRIIGRIYRVYDKENKKVTYTAKDWSGTPVFQDISDLPSLKKQFIKNGKNLTLTLPQDRHILAVRNEELKRELEVEEIRKKNTDKEQDLGLAR